MYRVNPEYKKYALEKKGVELLYISEITRNLLWMYQIGNVPIEKREIHNKSM